MLRGFIVNKFRGDPALFDDGMEAIARTHRLARARPRAVSSPSRDLLPAEDALGARSARVAAKPARAARSPCRSCRASPISTISTRSTPSPRSSSSSSARRGAARRRRPRRPARLEGDDRRPGGAARSTAGTSTSPRIARRGGPVLGLCGGYQMLGRTSHDPAGIEGPPAASRASACSTSRPCSSATSGSEAVRGHDRRRPPFAGYEMHMGVTEGPDGARPFARLADGTPEGAVSADGRVIGTYVHGLFADDRQRSAWLARLGAGPPRWPTRRWSTPRSTASPRTSPRTSISRRCSACRGDQ